MGYLTNRLKELRHTSRNRRTGATTRKRYEYRLRFERLEERALLAVVSHWTADNTAADSVGTNHGTLISGATYAAGQIGQAFSFDGVDDRVGVADSASLALTGSLTIESWVKPSSYPALASASGLIIFRGDDRGGLDPYQLALTSGGAMRFQVNSLDGAASVSAPMPLGEFVHTAGTLDDATGVMRLYMNGTLVSQTVTAIRPFGNLDPASNPGVGIGSHGSYPTTPHRFLFSGLIDELKLHDNALTAEEVSGIFNSGKGDLQPLISIADQSVTEGKTSTYLVDVFVQPHSGGLTNAHQGVLGPNGDLYVASGDTDSVLRYNGTTGAFIAAVVPAASNGLDLPWGIVFGPDGKLYVAGRRSDNILRYDPATQQVETFIAPGNGLWGPVGMTFGADGQLYVANSDRGTIDSSPNQDQILRYAGPGGGPNGELPGTFLSVFVAAGSGGASALDNPNHLAFHGDHLYVTNTRGDSINRYDAYSGAFDTVFVTQNSGGLDIPIYLLFHSDGLLYVASQGTGEVFRYNGTTGAFVDTFAESPVGSAAGNPASITVGTDGLFYVPYSREVLRYGTGTVAQFTIRLNSPFPTPVSVNYATADGTATAGSDYSSTPGTVTFAPGEWQKTVTVPTLDDTSYEGNETFVVNLSSPVGGVIADGQGLGTIIDNEPQPTKFYVVNDATANQTYEYGATGAVIENYAINSGNTEPRGAASTAAGTTVWVVDANKTVFVYDTSGVLLGSWTAGSLSGAAQVEGIATNGTDIWIVDAKQDKVYLYAGAASRLSGNQNAASSFALNSGNKSPKDIVTDGVSLWVVNDTTTDKVFKYSTSGTLRGSWNIDPANAKPTGITLDPTDVRHLWIVDSGTTKVYRYDDAVGLTTGSRTASANFALGAGNTNPQGIADPPPPSSALTSSPTVLGRNDKSLVAIAVAWSAGQATTASLSSNTTNRLSDSQRVIAAGRSVDEIMGRFGSDLEPVRSPASGTQTMASMSRRPATQRDDVNLEVDDGDLNASIDLIAHDLLEMRPSRRGQ